MKALVFALVLIASATASAQARDCKAAATGEINTRIRMNTLYGQLEAIHAVTLPQREQVAQALEGARGHSGSPMRKQQILSLLRSRDNSKKFFVANLNYMGQKSSVLVVNDAGSCAPEGVWPLASEDTSKRRPGAR